MIKAVGVVVILSVAMALTGVFLLNRSEKTNKDLNSNSLNLDEKIAKITASPFPFLEITIPYLKSREYNSTLGALEEISQNNNYITYLTSFDSDGFRVNGILTKPIGEMPGGGWPAIVFVHGYIPPSLYKTQSNYAAYVDGFAKNGFVVFKIDLRGHADSEGEANGAYYSGDYVVDVLNARAALLNSGFVRDRAVGLWGHSMAGNVTFRALAARGEIPAVVIWAGAVYSYADWKYGINDNSYRPPDDQSNRAKRRKELFDKYGEFDADSDFWKQVPATNYLDGISGALQVHHAVDDNVVGIEYSWNLMSIFNKTKIEHELFEYGSGGHNLTGSTFNLAMQRSVDFFKAKLN